MRGGDQAKERDTRPPGVQFWRKLGSDALDPGSGLHRQTFPRPGGTIGAGRDSLPKTSVSGRREEKMFTVAVVLFILWLLGYFAFHVTSALIHVLLAASFVSVAVGFLRRGSRPPAA